MIRVKKCKTLNVSCTCFNLCIEVSGLQPFFLNRPTTGTLLKNRSPPVISVLAKILFYFENMSMLRNKRIYLTQINE